MLICRPMSICVFVFLYVFMRICLCGCFCLFLRLIRSVSQIVQDASKNIIHDVTCDVMVMFQSCRLYSRVTVAETLAEELIYKVDAVFR